MTVPEHRLIGGAVEVDVDPGRGLAVVGDIDAVAAEQFVPPTAAMQHVVADAAHEEIVTAPAPELVGAVAAVEHVGVGVALHQVGLAAALKLLDVAQGQHLQGRRGLAELQRPGRGLEVERDRMGAVSR